jgi:hypothetical protein
MAEPLIHSTVDDESTWLSWGRSALAVAIVAVLLTLGVANIALRARWHEVEDGVLWGARTDGRARRPAAR